MQNNSRNTQPLEQIELGSFKSYLLGFLLSILLSLATYFAVAHQIFLKQWLFFTIVALALVQMLVQFVFFLQLGKESKPRWNLIVFLFMLLIVIVLVIGSLWIMANLDYREMSPIDMEKMGLHEGI
jgi:cytochrome o ubiquinol oxidase operon protein cyoD